MKSFFRYTFLEKVSVSPSLDFFQRPRHDHDHHDHLDHPHHHDHDDHDDHDEHDGHGDGHDKEVCLSQTGLPKNMPKRRHD